MTDELEQRLLDNASSADDPLMPAYWRARFDQMPLGELWTAWPRELAEQALPETTLDAVFRYLAGKLGVTLGAVRADYRNHLRSINDADPTTHAEWAEIWASGLPYHLADNGMFWLYDDEEKIFKGLTLDEAGVSVGRTEGMDGQNCKRVSDYRAIAGFAYTMKEQSQPAPFASAPIGVATDDWFYRVKGREIVREALDRDHHATFKIPVQPGDLRDGVFMSLVEAALTDKEQVDLLKQHFAATIFRLLWRMQKVCLWYGPGATGKSTFQKILEALMPANQTSAVPPHYWDQEYHSAAMAGKVLNVVGEIDERNPLGAAFKNVTGNGRINARHPTHKPFSFVSQAAQIFCSNYLPPTVDRSDSFWRRWSIIEFRNVVPPQHRDPMLAEKILRDELDVVLGFAFEGMRMLIDNSVEDRYTFSMTEREREVFQEWSLEANSVEAFLMDEDVVILDTVIAPEGEPRRCGRAVLYDTYSAWCRRNNMRPLGVRKFKKELDGHLGAKYGLRLVQQDSRRWWLGVGLVARDDREAF